MKTSLAMLITTTLIFVGVTGSNVSPASQAADKNPGVLYQELIKQNGDARVPPVSTDSHGDESINVSAIPARFIYVKFPGEDSKIITLRDLDNAINERAVQAQEVPDPVNPAK